MENKTQNLAETEALNKALVICRALVEAIKDEYATDYSSIDESWQWAINEMSDEVNETWRNKTRLISELTAKMDEELVKHGI